MIHGFTECRVFDHLPQRFVKLALALSLHNIEPKLRPAAPTTRAMRDLEQARMSKAAAVQLRSGPTWSLAPDYVCPTRFRLLKRISIRAPMPDDAPDRRRREVRRKEPGAALGVFLDEAGTRAARKLTIGTGERRPVRARQL